MKSSRLEAFSDGVLAIIITIMVLELKIPEEPSFQALFAHWPVFLSYLISFVYIGIYWNNHHHVFQVVKTVNGKILWANLLLLFSLSLIPFTSAWLGEHYQATAPVATYGIILLFSGLSFTLLVSLILRYADEDKLLQAAIGNNFKNMLSILVLIIGVGLSFYNTSLAILCYSIVALIWFIPDRRIEKIF